jgi:hypothetical protein
VRTKEADGKRSGASARLFIRHPREQRASAGASELISSCRHATRPRKGKRKPHQQMRRQAV